MSSRERGRSSITSRLLLYFGLAYVALIACLVWLVAGPVDRAHTERLLDDLEAVALISAHDIPGDPDLLPTWVDELSEMGDVRFTVIDRDGSVVADSHSDPESTENHAGRPEVVAAIAGEVGRDHRFSETTGFDQFYVAVPAGDLILRLSESSRDLAAESSLRRSLLPIVILLGVIGLGITAWAAKRLTAPVRRLTDQASALIGNDVTPPGGSSGLREIDDLAAAIIRLDAAGRDRVGDAERASATLEVVLGALPQGTILFDEDDVVVYANPSAYELLGTVPDVLSGLVPFSFQQVVEACRADRVPESAIAEHGKPVRSLRAIATPFADDKRVLLVIADVTERERSASVRRDFVANASHELKTPVSAIIASSEALRIAVERNDESAMRFAKQIEVSAHQLDWLVSDLLDLSRLERDHPDLAPVALDHLVREEVERARTRAEERGIELVSDLTPAHVGGSRRDLAIATRNLLDNALQYTGSGGVVDVSLTTWDGEALLVVSDTGDGIPTRDLARVFERFYRVDSARSRATGGTGLGLAIVKHVVESHGGSVEVESELGAGSRFSVRLPLTGEESPPAN